MIDSTDEAMRTAHVIFAAAVGTALAGCGQKGPLYLRDNPPPGVTQAKPDQYKPVPYPKGAGVDNPADADTPREPSTGTPRDGVPGK